MNTATNHTNRTGLTDASWHRSSASLAHGECIELTTWRTSSFTELTNCVELATDTRHARLGVRDSKHPTGGVLVLPDSARLALLRSVTSDAEVTA
jgi:hypothetical protein